MNFGIESFDEITLDKIREAAAFLKDDIPVSRIEKIANDQVWAKFELENPTGSFKARGAPIFFEWLKSAHSDVTSVIAASRGNYGQAVAFAAKRAGLRCTIFVPVGNSSVKNDAMKNHGAEVMETGRDFVESAETALSEAKKTGAHFVPSFDWKLVVGVATYGLEMFEAAPKIDAVFVPIGLGSGICGVAAARNAIGSSAKIFGVVAENAPTYADSFEAGQIVAGTEIPESIADGVACRVPNEASFEVIQSQVTDVVRVSELEIKSAMRELYEMTDRRVEGAGAIAFAARKNYKAEFKNPAVIISGGNVDDSIFEEVFNGA